MSTAYDRAALIPVIACALIVALAASSCARGAQADATHRDSPPPSQEIPTTPDTAAALADDDGRAAHPAPTAGRPDGIVQAAQNQTADQVLLEGTANDVIPPAITAQGGDRFLRTRLVRTAGKYPLHRREEVIRRVAGGVIMVSVLEMVADHLLVSRDPAHPTAFADLAAAAGCTVRSTIPRSNLALLAFPYTSHDDYPAALQRLAAAPGVRVAESDWIVQAIGTPDDGSFSQLWGMHNTGQTGGTADADIDAPEAWNISTGSASVLVGVIDTGIDATHPDLAANMWQNPGETGLDTNGNDKRTNAIDDDGNGYIDDFRGWDFVNADNNPADDHYHGTHCAGTIGGVGNNGQGVAGVCWNVSLVGLKFLSASGSGATSDAVSAVLYANTIGCTLTSNSWGGGGFSQALKDAIDAANASGSLFVAAAGNNASNNDAVANYPSNIDSPNIIAVAATDHNDLLASFSCYGATTVDLGAPGVSVYSCQPGGLYQLLSGTSMATPHVAGACALLKSANPSLTGAQIKAALLANTDPVPALAGKCVTGGRLNLFKAASAVSGPVLTAPSIAISENGNGDGLLNPGEQAVITVTLASAGSVGVNGITGTLSTSDPAVTIETATATYGDLATGQSSSGSNAYRIRLADGATTPHAVALSLTATATGSGPWTFPCSVTYVTSTQISGIVTRTGTGSPLAGATVTWKGPKNGSAVTGTDGTYLAIVPDGSYQIAATAPGLNPGTPVATTVPPAAIVNLNLGAAGLVVSPLAVSFTSDTTAAVTVSNPGDALLTYTVSNAVAVTTGLWHTTSYRTATGSGTSWYYGDETKRNYDTGAANSGALAFNAVAVPTADPTLRFSSWRATETGTTFDLSQVQVSTNGGMTWTALGEAIPSATPRRDGVASDSATGILATWTSVFQETDTSATWHPVTVDLSAYSGTTIALRFWFNTVDSIANTAEGWYVDDIRIGTIPLDQWLTVTPMSGTVAAGGATTLQLAADSAAMPIGTSMAQVGITSNAPVNGSANVAVTCTKVAAPELSLAGMAVGDAAAPALGDADGSPEPGETVTVVPTWSNAGSIAAVGVTTTISSTSAYVQVVTASAAMPDIAGGGSAAALTPCVLDILPGCPNGTTIPVTVSATLAGSTWTGSRTILVKWSSRLSGVVRNGLDQPVSGATVTVGSLSAVSAADGTYAVSGIPAGTIPVVAAKAGTQSASTTITTPPDATWNPLVGAPAIALNPTSLALSTPPGGTASALVTVSNPGDLPLTWSASAGSVPTATGLWHQTSYRSVAGQPSWYYGDETKRTYDTGTANNGNLTFTQVAVPAVATPTLTWQQWRITESTSASWDQCLVQVSTDGATWTTAFQTVLNDGQWHTETASLSAYAGKVVQIRFRFDTVDSGANMYEGWYVNDIRLMGTPIAAGGGWLSATPDSGTVPAGGSTAVMVSANAAALPGGTTSGSLIFTSNALAPSLVSLPVACTVITPPNLAAGTATIIDSGAAPISGDGDAKAEPGESIAWSLPLANSGTTAASDVVATLSTTSTYVTFPQAVATYGTIAGNTSGTAQAPFIIAIAPTCPSGILVPVTCTITAGNGGPWTVSTLTLLVQWDCRLSGVATAAATGAKLANAYISVGGKYAYTDSAGAYTITGLTAGSLGASATASSYLTTSTTITTPTVTTWNPVLHSRDMTVTPTSLAVTTSKGQTTTRQLTLTASGSLPTTWSTSSLPTWLTLTPASGSINPGASTIVTATFNGGTVNGTFSAAPSFTTNSSVSTYKQWSAAMTVKSATVPTAAPVAAAVQEDGTATIQLLGADADGDALTYSIVTAPLHGTATLGANGMVTYKPTALYHGADTFTYRVSDGLDLSPTAPVAITVNHVNHPPTAWPCVVHVTPDVTSAFGLPVRDVDQDPLTITVLSAPRIGTLTVSGATASYTPPAGFVGQDSCTISASDGLVASPSVQVIISVTGSLTADTWPTLGNGPDHRGAVERSLGNLVLTADWTKSFSYPIHQVAIGGGRVYYTSRTTTRAGALDPATGAEQWAQDFIAPATLNPPTYHAGSVYLQRGYTSTSQLFRLNADTGATIWQAPYTEQWEHHGAPTVDGDRVWINGGTFGGMYGFNRTTGSQVFFQTKEQFDQWTPTLSDGVLYAWAGKTLAAHDPLTGALQWSVTLPNGGQPYSQYGTAISDGTRIYVIGSSTYYPGPPTIYAVNQTTHAISWSRTGTYVGMPALQGGSLFAYTNAGIEQLNAATGAVEVVYPLAGIGSSADQSVQPIVTQDALIGASTSTTAIFARGQSAPRQTVPYGGHLSLAG